MITEKQRRVLWGFQTPPGDCLGFDCEGIKLRANDKVEVIRDEMPRQGQSDFDYCSVGKHGVLLDHYMGWVVLVEFEGNTVGCLDLNLRKLRPAGK